MTTNLSIIICTHNRAESLEATLLSLSRQEGIDKKHIWEIVVVDNNSSDHTKDLIQSFSDKIPIQYYFEKEQGKSYALNTGIGKAKGQILAFTDDDVIVDPSWVANIFNAVRSKPDYLAYGGKVVPIWPDNIPSWIQKKGPYSKPIVGSAIVSHDHGDQAKEYGLKMWVPPGCNVFFRREVFELFGGYRQDLGPRPGKPGFYHEDSEFGFRLKKNGIQIFYFPDAIVYHPVDEKRLTKKFMLRYFWNSGMAYDFKSIGNGAKLYYFRKVFIATFQTISLTGKYLLSNFRPIDTKMHYLCRIIFNSGNIYSNVKRIITK